MCGVGGEGSSSQTGVGGGGVLCPLRYDAVTERNCTVPLAFTRPTPFPRLPLLRPCASAPAARHPYLAHSTFLSIRPTPSTVSLRVCVPRSIEDLIQREYLERDKDNPTLFKYLA